MNTEKKYLIDIDEILRMVLIIITVFIVTVDIYGCGCSQAYRQSVQISHQADNFETPRKLTIINTRTDQKILEFTGTFSVQRDGYDIDILCAIGDDRYEKHFFTLNDWTIYIIEDVSNQGVRLYDRKIVYFNEDAS
jgi:hypothetical protein